MKAQANRYEVRTDKNNVILAKVEDMVRATRIAKQFRQTFGQESVRIEMITPDGRNYPMMG